MENKRTSKIILCALFTTLIIVGTFITIPVPILPFTLQILFTTLAGLLLGGKLGSYSVLVYIILGLIGVPVFTQGGGLGYIIKPSFGYIIGFLLGTYVTGKIANKVGEPSLKRTLIASFVGLIIIYIIGMSYYYVIANFIIHVSIDLKTLFIYCFLIYMPADIVLCILSGFLGKKLIPIIKKQGDRKSVV